MGWAQVSRARALGSRRRRLNVSLAHVKENGLSPPFVLPGLAFSLIYLFSLCELTRARTCELTPTSSLRCTCSCASKLTCTHDCTLARTRTHVLVSV